METIAKKTVGFIEEKGSRANPVSATTIANQFKIPENHATCTTTRKFIQQAIKNGYPIESSSRGYYWMEKENEVQEYIASLKGRMIALAICIRNVERAFYGKEIA